MGTSRGIHWKSPTIALGALVAGILFAAGHHVFYRNLDGTEVPTGHDLSIGRWSNLSPQSFNIAVGTLLAFLAKTSLCLAIGVAYVQTFFNSLKKRNTRVSTVDSTMSLNENILAFLDGSVWINYPISVLLAAFAWLTPLAAIITPATLNVVSRPHPSSEMRSVSNVDFTSLNFAFLPDHGRIVPTYEYAGPQLAVSKVVAASAAQGGIVPIAAPGPLPNATYEYQFPGPALQCQDISGSSRQTVEDNIFDASRINDCNNRYGYVAWTPDPNGITPFVRTRNDSFTLRYGSPWSSGTYGYKTTESGDVSALTLYLATLPNMPDVNSDYCGSAQMNRSVFFRGATLLECHLSNITYHTKFSWNRGVQAVEVAHGGPPSDVKPVPVLGGVAPFGTYLPNGTLVDPSSDDPWSYNVSAVRNVAYQSVMDAFGKLLVGTISRGIDGSSVLSSVNTSIMSTILSDARELDILRTFGTRADVHATLQQYSNSTWLGTSVPINSTAGRFTLKTALEELFQNITISLISSPLLQADSQTPYAPPPVNVTFETYWNVYDYSPLTLWISYGIVIFFSIVAVAIGLTATIANGMSFSNGFSTVMRMTSHAVLTNTITAQDAIGQDPVPKHIANARIAFLRGVALGKQRETEKTTSTSNVSTPSRADARLLPPAR